MEALNFLHQNAKCVHAGLSPENLFVTASGKLKIAGFNFTTQMGTEEMSHIPVSNSVKFNEVHMFPNLKFAAPEISKTSQACPQSDLFSCMLILHYLLALSKGMDPFLLAHYDKSNPTAHASELGILQSKLSIKISSHPHELQEMFRQVLTASSPSQRGNLGMIVSRPWFQDPLLKTIRYLENLEYKEMQQKV